MHARLENVEKKTDDLEKKSQKGTILSFMEFKEKRMRHDKIVKSWFVK